MMTKESREARSALWLQHWQACEASGEGMAAYARGHDLDADEGYRWKRILRRAQRWPTSARVKQTRPLRFARVRIAARAQTESSTALKLHLQLSNGRRAELLLGDEQQLPRVLALLEQAG
jgi:hypothetical protein